MLGLHESIVWFGCQKSFLIIIYQRNSSLRSCKLCVDWIKWLIKLISNKTWISLWRNTLMQTRQVISFHHWLLDANKHQTSEAVDSRFRRMWIEWIRVCFPLAKWWIVVNMTPVRTAENDKVVHEPRTQWQRLLCLYCRCRSNVVLESYLLPHSIIFHNNVHVRGCVRTES